VTTIAAPLAVQVAHRSVRSFLPDPVPEEQLEAMVAAAQSAPTGAARPSGMVVPSTAPTRVVHRLEGAGSLAGRDRIREALVGLGLPSR
jgi:nitroreductase